MIEMHHLTKKYKDATAVNDLSLNISPGFVTGFLGPNGAGKTTTMKMILGLTRPTSGTVTVNGEDYKDLTKPLTEVGALIDSYAVDAQLTAKQHLDIMATAGGLAQNRPEEVLQQTGLRDVANKKIQEFSLGMKQRLGIATALLGDPETIIFDEPFNGLDVDGIQWLRELTKNLAAGGKAVLVSSHLMSEIQAIAEKIIVLAQGELIAEMTIEEMAQRSLSAHILVRSEDNGALKNLLENEGALVRAEKERLQVRKIELETIGELAKQNNLALYELTKTQPSLEDLFIELTEGKIDYVTQDESKEGGETIL
jgi:ABC-2 type transport system ATP-binding protein